MKKLFAILLVCVLVFAIGACKPNSTDPQSTTNADSYEITWQDLPDTEIVDSWKPDDGVSDEYILFTPEGKLRVVYGTVIFEADITFGADALGNKSAYTDGNYLYGQWVYTIVDDTLTITYPDGTVKVFTRVDYTPITLQAKDDFVADEKLVGTWTNELYMDSYRFTEDGYVVFNQELADGVYSYETEIMYTYTVDGNKVTLYCFKDNSGEETSETFEFTIDGTKLLLGENDYYLNGEGSPTAETGATA